MLTWLDLVWAAMTMYVAPLTVLLWTGWAVFRFRGWGRALVPFSLFGAALPAVFALACLVPGLVERFWHGRQLDTARIEALADEPLLSEHGHPIGVRFAYQVDFPLGLNSLGQEPPADSPSAGLYIPDRKSTLMYFATRATSLPLVARGGFPRGMTTVTIDAVPAFMPMAFQSPKAFPASDPRNLCFRWKGADERARQLSAQPQSVLMEIGPYGRYVKRGARGTVHTYRLADFYEGARAEGATECP